MKVSTLDDLIRELRVAFDGDKVDPDHVIDLMKAYSSDPQEWRKFAIFDRYRYTRNLVDEGNGKYNLILLCWGEGHGSAIHDHSDAHCFMKILDGSLRETRFEWPDKQSTKGDPEKNAVHEMRPISSAVLEKNAVLYINDSLGLHRVENPSHTEPAVSLHLYVPAFDTCHVFDHRTGQKIKCNVTLWSKYGQRISELKVPPSCVLADTSAPKTTSETSE